MRQIPKVEHSGAKVAAGHLPDPHVIRRVRRETHDTFTLELSPVDGEVHRAFRPGQFNMVYVFGAGEVPVSISGDPMAPSPLIHTIRAVGSVTRMIGRMKKGDILGIRGPFGAPWPVETSAGKDIVIVAGGIGLAPLRPALLQIISRREEYGRVILLYGARTPADMLYRRELERWRSRFDLEVAITVDRAMGGWKGTVGVITTLIPRPAFDAANAIAMVCGPEVMMRFAAMELQKRGIAADRIYISMERNMKCGAGLCGHCQFGPAFVCKDGPVFRYSTIKDLFVKREI